jgi:hypothetical protein
MEPREYRSKSPSLFDQVDAGVVHVDDEGLRGPTLGVEPQTLAWTDIQAVKRVRGKSYDRIHVIPKTRGKRAIIFSPHLDSVGELVNLIKEKAGLLPPIEDLETFLSRPRVYRYDVKRLGVLWLLVLGFLGISAFLACVAYRFGQQRGLSPEDWRRIVIELWKHNASAIIIGVVLCLGLIGYFSVLIWRLLRLGATEVIMEWQWLTERRGAKIVTRIDWKELRAVEMAFDRTVLTTVYRRRLIVYNKLSRFDEFNQIVRHQKERLGL